MRVLVTVSLMLAGLLAVAGPGRADDKRDAPSKSSYDHLKVLEKSVGRWEGTTDQLGGRKLAATLTVEWMLDKQFLREELRVKMGDKTEFTVITVRGWDAEAGVMTLHTFTSQGDSGTGTGKFGEAAKGKVSFTAFTVSVSRPRVGAKTVIEFPEADRMVITDTERTLGGKALPDGKIEWRRKK